MRIGFIGLGNMGGHMAMNVIAGGHDVVVHDIRREAAERHLAAGARWAATPRGASEDREIVFTSLPGPAEVEQVALGEGGVLAGASPDTVYVDLSTNSPTLMRRVHEEFAGEGVAVLDAPVSGGSKGAEAATLAVMAGGDEAAYERAKPVLDLIGDKVSYIGPSGAGAIAKLVHNLITISARVIVGEALTLGVKAGVDPEALLRAVQNGSFGQGNLIHRTVPNIVYQGAYDNVGFALDLSLKDLRLALELAEEFGVPVGLGAVAEAEVAEAVDAGLGALDSSASIILQERRAGVELRAADAIRSWQDGA